VFSTLCIYELCTLKYYDPVLGGPGARRWLATANAGLGVWLLLHLAPLVVRRIRADFVVRLPLVGAIAVVAGIHVVLALCELSETAYPRSEVPRRVVFWGPENRKCRVEVEPDEFDPVVKRLSADIRAADGQVDPRRDFFAWINADVTHLPTLRFRTFTVKLSDGRVRVNEQDFGPIGHGRIAIRFGAVFVDGEHRGSFFE